MIYIGWLSINLLVKFGNKRNKQNTTKKVNLSCALTSFTVVVVQHPKVTSLSLMKNKFCPVDLTCWQSMPPLCLQFLEALNTSSWNDVWPKVTAVILKILHLLPNILHLEWCLSNKWKLHSATYHHVIGLVHATGVHKRNTVHMHKFALQRKAWFWCNSTG